LLHDDNGNGVSDDDERVVLRTQANLNHGIALNGGFLYASTPTTVYRWPYAGNRQVLGEPQQVVTGIPNGGHVTRTLQFDTQGRLYVSVGSGSNLDNDSRRARLLRYAANALGTASTFAQGELFADGLRNEVGLAIDSQGRIWGVENGRDNLQRQDLGTDIHQNNPGEELNLFLEQNAGRFYGYPYCWSEFNLPTTGSGPGTQWADPDNTTHDDAWCKNTTNVLPPVLVMQGHSAPLDVKFYAGSAFPADVVGDAFITFHGSWNRTTATGYKVVRVPFGADGMPAGDPVPLLESANPGDTDAQWPHRPVSLGIGKSGQLFVSSDASGVIIAVGHEPI
jgi:glucose/arabinose dehydrogenase